MNIVITLPVNLIAEILEGRKMYEIRTKIPTNFNINRDVVYVVQKGTKKVVLYFTIVKFITGLDLNKNARYIAKKAAVLTGWLKNYAENKSMILAWEIGCYCKLTDCSAVYKQLGIKTNPQSYIYTECDWRQFRISYYRWNTELDSYLKSRHLKPAYERQIWLMYNKKENYYEKNQE